jgi:hypothetical protein
MTPDLEKQRLAIRANIMRYETILATYLTPHERAYVERRLEEETSALRQFTRNDRPVATQTQMQ